MIWTGRIRLGYFSVGISCWENDWLFGKNTSNGFGKSPRIIVLGHTPSLWRPARQLKMIPPRMYAFDLDFSCASYKTVISPCPWIMDTMDTGFVWVLVAQVFRPRLLQTYHVIGYISQSHISYSPPLDPHHLPVSGYPHGLKPRLMQLACRSLSHINPYPKFRWPNVTHTLLFDMSTQVDRLAGKEKMLRPQWSFRPRLGNLLSDLAISFGVQLAVGLLSRICLSWLEQTVCSQ